MGASEIIHLGDPADFFAPVSSDLLDSLIGQYRAMRSVVEYVSNAVTGETATAVRYLLEGNQDRSTRYVGDIGRMFGITGGIAALNAAYWSKALALTDVLDAMPQKRRDEWNKSINDMTTPEFEESAVRPTIETLLASRAKFLAERVDGIFRALSGEHVTNSPMGFGKRMILSGVLNFYSSNSQSGQINDLRCVIAKFMGRDEPKHYSSNRLIETLKYRWGEWVTLDGGAIKIRLYKKGTAHLEVHPDMAWRLNSILASMYPQAIPAEHRTKPKKQTKEFAMILRPLPFAVIEIIGEARKDRGTNCYRLGYGSVNESKVARAEALRVFEMIGGVITDKGIEFGYDPADAINEIITSGCIPDQVSHQFYPTPENVALAAVALAEIGDSDTCLEPSAGQGGLAALMPKDRTRCIEISALHCKVLTAKGYDAVPIDFLKWPVVGVIKFDRIVMNPPFSEGRWQAHLAHAATMLRPGGRLVAILPSSAKGKNVLPGFNLTWSRDYSNEFAGTSVSVVILTAEAE